MSDALLPEVALDLRLPSIMPVDKLVDNLRLKEEPSLVVVVVVVASDILGSLLSTEDDAVGIMVVEDEP